MHYVKAKTLLTKWNGMNIYRGCTHGCIYCDSRSNCYNFDHKFEDIEVKENAPELLENILKSKRNKCMISTGSMSDPYMPIEMKLQLTRKCLEIIEKYGFGATVITKSDLILRDLDVLKSINKKAKCVVQMTLTTYDEELCKKLEPHVCTTKRRFEVLKILNENNIPTIVWFTPILPYINDTKENMQGILDDCIKSNVKGIICFNAGMTLREGDREYYYSQLDKLFPNLSQKYIKNYGNSYHVVSKNNDELMDIFNRTCEEHHIICNPDECFRYTSEYVEEDNQIKLF
ncbi:MAG: radical SAM protein [Clostridia bacterium]|nr:radical SAM protein [Clostridia bacterium]